MENYTQSASAIMEAAEAEIRASTMIVTSTRQKGPIRRVLASVDMCCKLQIIADPNFRCERAEIHAALPCTQFNPVALRESMRIQHIAHD